MGKVKNTELSMCVLKRQEMKTYGESGFITPCLLALLISTVDVIQRSDLSPGLFNHRKKPPWPLNRRLCGHYSLSRRPGDRYYITGKGTDFLVQLCGPNISLPLIFVGHLARGKALGT